MFYTGEIKSKVNARQFAIEQANAIFAKLEKVSDENKLIELAEKIEKFIVGDADVPEFSPADSDFTKIVELFAKMRSNTTDEKPEANSAEPSDKSVS